MEITDKQIRLECLKMAVDVHTVDDRIKDAQKLWNFVEGGIDKKVDSKSEDIYKTPPKTEKEKQLERALISLTLDTVALNTKVGDESHAKIDSEGYPEDIKIGIASLDKLTKKNAPKEMRKRDIVFPLSPFKISPYLGKTKDGLVDLYEESYMMSSETPSIKKLSKNKNKKSVKKHEKANLQNIKGRNATKAKNRV